MALTKNKSLKSLKFDCGANCTCRWLNETTFLLGDCHWYFPFSFHSKKTRCLTMDYMMWYMYTYLYFQGLKIKLQIFCCKEENMLTEKRKETKEKSVVTRNKGIISFNVQGISTSYNILNFLQLYIILLIKLFGKYTIIWSSRYTKWVHISVKFLLKTLYYYSSKLYGKTEFATSGCYINKSKNCKLSNIKPFVLVPLQYV